MKEPYIWNYNIKIKTKEGEFEYEKETLENLENLLNNHQGHTKVRAKRLVKERGKKNETRKKE